MLKFLFVLSMVMLPLVGEGLATPALAAGSYCLTENDSVLLQLINGYREDNDLQPLTASPTLGAAALNHSKDMAAKDYSDHVGKDGSTIGSRIEAAGYDPNGTYENIYYGSPGADTPQAAFAWWKSSPGHNENMLRPGSLAIGIGSATSTTTDLTHWTTTFGPTVDVEAKPCGGEMPGNGEDYGTLTVTIKECPPDADPEAGDFTHCKDVEDPEGLLINMDTDTSVELSTAPGRLELTHNYVWDALPVGTYQIDPTLPGKTWILVNVGIAGAQTRQESFEVLKDEDVFVEVFVYDDSETGTTEDDEMDTDGDGLYDVDETDVYMTDPEDPDTDNDGSDDGLEIYSGTDPLDEDSQPGDSALEDSDNDGLYNTDETNIYGTDPDEADTDRDSVDDGQEIYDGTDPLDPNSVAGGSDPVDTDGDGLFDQDEDYIYGTDPENPDTDGDEIDDGQEVFDGTDPNVVDE
jgi:uncharacterized protein YkwD